jgi:hypothetical protein
MKGRSRKHHYLPRHYLRGFTDRAGSFFVYDKASGKIFRSSPDAAFFENDLNTVAFPDGKQSDLLESLYAQVEREAWHSLDNIRRSHPDIPISVRDRMHLFFFLSFLHWRLPANAAFVEGLSQRFFGQEKELGFFKLKSMKGANIPQGVIDEIRTSTAWKKFSKVILPFAPFFAGDSWWQGLTNWRFLYAADGNSWYVVGDNPIVTRGCNDHDPSACLKDFVFPVSGRILLIAGGEHLAQMLPAEFTVQYGVAVIERAQRFVACHNKSFLEALIRDHEIHVRFGKTSRIIPELFEMMGREKRC